MHTRLKTVVFLMFEQLSKKKSVNPWLLAWWDQVSSSDTFMLPAASYRSNFNRDDEAKKATCKLGLLWSPARLKHRKVINYQHLDIISGFDFV